MLNALAPRPAVTRPATLSRTRPSEIHLKQLMLEGMRGDARSYNALLRAVSPLLMSFYGRRMHHGEADVEDLTQETLLAIHTRRVSYDEGRPFTPWLFAIARHKLIDYFRRRRVSSNIDDLSNILRVEGFDEAIDARLDIERLLESLPRKQAKAIRHTRLKGLSVIEAASMMGIGESDVKVSVHRGLKRLVGQLEGAAA